MKISIVIVSYNVKYFLERCIDSVLGSSLKDVLEIIVVDNQSKDGTDQLVRQKFPQVIFIANQENVGFSRANNQAVKVATGEYILILNPDTLLQSDTLEICLRTYEKMESNNISVGMIGVPMYDGSGNYLPESKRGFPSPFVSFCKIFGLSSIFSKSKFWNRYYLGHLSKDENHFAPILTGAFMFTKREKFIEVGGFDETYFMYGEDIDLSYCFEQIGCRNYYLSETQIIHFKGESTRKLSFDYVKRFYEAMVIFARKHFGSTRALTYSFAIRSAIYLNAGISFVAGIIRRLFSSLIDSLIIGSTIYGFTKFWELFYFKMVGYYQHEFIIKNIGLYIITFILICLLSGKYHKRFSPAREIKILFTALISLLVLYSLFPVEIRFSRAVVLFGGVLAGVGIYLKDWFVHRLHVVKDQHTKRVTILGQASNAADLLALLDRRKQVKFVGFIGSDDPQQKNDRNLGDSNQLEDIVRFHKIDELIFIQSDASMEIFMKAIAQLGTICQFKLYTPLTRSVVGSFSKNIPGQIETLNIEYAINTSYIYL